MPEITRYDIEQWVKTMPTGQFHYTSVLGLRGKLSPPEDNKLRKIIYDLCHAKEPIIESIGKNDGYYRPIQNNLVPVDWQHVGAKQDFPIDLPFNLRKYCFIYPNTVIVIAGSKSSGKTGFLYRTVVLNMSKVNTILLSNMEGGKEQMHDRFYAMKDVTIPDPSPFTTYPVYDNFHDFIKQPNSLYVIDYIDTPDSGEFYMIGPAISKIRKKLDNSVAVVGLQKPLHREIAFGGEGTLKDATLYLAIDSGVIKIVDAKVPTDPKVHPKNMKWSFLYDEEGTNFINIQPSYDET